MAGPADSSGISAQRRPKLSAASRSILAAAGSLSKFGHAAITLGQTRDVLTRTSGFLQAYDFSLNPYSGCAFGCTYCYAAFFARTPDERASWGFWVRVKDNAVSTLARRRDGSLDGKRIYLSSVTDPYQPVERKLGLTRALLTILCTRHAPILVVQTRSPDVVRDIDLFSALRAKGGKVRVNITITTDDEDIRRTFEPYCPANSRRLEAAEALCSAGIDSCITLTPILLIADADRLADQLLRTGIRHFVIQDFQFSSGGFVASTREEAQHLMATKLGCALEDFRQEYQAHYTAVRDRLHARLCPPVRLTEGKLGFAPPR